MENAEHLVKNFFGKEERECDTEATQSKELRRMRRRTEDAHKEGKEACLNRARSFLDQAKAMVSSQNHCISLNWCKIFRPRTYGE